jgi:hypothetical protein
MTYGGVAMFRIRGAWGLRLGQDPAPMIDRAGKHLFSNPTALDADAAICQLR